MTLDLDDHRADWVKDTASNLPTSRRKLSGAQLLRALIDLADTDPDVLRRAGELTRGRTPNQAMPGDLYCPRHGLLRHITLHEAGHAVAALDRNMAFFDLTIYEPGQGPSNPDGVVAGGVNMSTSNWMTDDPAASLEMALAGCLTERRVLGHELPEGYVGDLYGWRRGQGLTAGGEASLDAVNQLIGGSFADVTRRTASWVSDNIERIKTVADALAKSTSRSLSHADVARLSG